MILKPYQTGDEGNAKLSLFNSSIIYALDDSIFSIWINHQVEASIDFYCTKDGTLFITAFETINKNSGVGKRIIRQFQKYDDVEKIIIQPVANSVEFWEKMDFYPISCEEWIWEK